MRINDWKLSITGKVKRFILPALAAITVLFPDLGTTTPDVQMAIAPIIMAALVSGGLSGGLGLAGSWLGSRKTKQQKDLWRAQRELADFQRRFGEQGMEKGFDIGGDLESFFDTLMSGDRQQKADLYGSQMGIVSDQFDEAERQILEGLPRGGELFDSLAGGRMDKARAIQQLFAGSEERGAAGMQALMNAYLSQGQSNIGGAATGYGNIGSQIGAQQQAGYTNAMGVGSWLGQLLGNPELYKQQPTQNGNNQVKAVNQPELTGKPPAIDRRRPYDPGHGEYE